MTIRFLRHFTTAVFACLLLSTPLLSAEEADSLESGWKFIGVPYLMANSDHGLIGGAGLGFSYDLDFYMLIGGDIATKGPYRIGIEGEVVRWNRRNIFLFGFTKGPLDLFPQSGIDPDALASATIENMDVKISSLTNPLGNWEIGPALWLEHYHGLSPKDMNERELRQSNIPRFRPSTVVVGGIHARWRNTNAVRPLHGGIVEALVQSGFVTENSWDSPKPEIHAKLRGAFVQPLGNRLRLYVRGESRWMQNAPESLRPYIGGEKNLRGQPYRRDPVRGVISGRTQLYWTYLKDFKLPFKIAHAILPFFPEWGMDFEAVLFHDIGVGHDPDFGWLEPRNGYGAGLRFVLPPNLVVRFDLAQSPDGEWRYYLGIGETL